jgi:hypothetical protein
MNACENEANVRHISRVYRLTRVRRAVTLDGMTDASAPFGKRPTPLAPAILDEVVRLNAALASADAAAAGPLWGAVHKLLLKVKVDPKVIMSLVANRDRVRFDLMVRWLHGEEVVIEAPKERVIAAVDPEVVKHALRAFRKRLKFSRLDAESRLGIGPMTGGKKHEIDAIIAPREFPLAVWEALVAAGKLRSERGGFYALVNDDIDDE